MRMLKFAVEGQQLAKRGDFAGVTAGSKGYLRCHFEQSDPGVAYGQENCCVQ